ncbi:MAG: hypothetical protein JKY32_03555 [Rhizobiales bacterium]|nr:hypothetical protein [Hyphomicrobiales bacterium]
MPESKGKPVPVEIRLYRGSLYLGGDIYERYFAGLDAVILLRREGDLYIMPVRNTAGGGYLLKLMNKDGDRIINAMDFFREHGLDDFEEKKLHMFWDQTMAGLKSSGLFEPAN